MRWNSSFVVLIVAIAAACSGGSNSNAEELREFQKLEDSLIRLSNAPEGDWIDELDRIRRIDIKSDEISQIRTLCLSAYDAFGEATLKLQTARRKVANVEEKIVNANPVDATGAGLSHAEAIQSTDDVSAALDKAEALVKSCISKRRKKRDQLSGHGEE